ncbi:hypothetical protein [Nocardia sp. NPDC051981]|uniref:hypothetical protein n=1 Tax=Nocardia sp. NPDC051981 TaxID=3155417 RepID=UPI00341A9364
MHTTVAPPRFALWREVLFAYLAPALSAGVGGLLTGRTELALAALTSIAGTSAVVAFLLGLWLRHRGARWTWPRRVPPAALAAGFALAAAAFGGLIAQLLSCTPWFPDRIRIDFPIAAALAAAIITWRWCAIRRKDDYR